MTTTYAVWHTVDHVGGDRRLVEYIDTVEARTAKQAVAAVRDDYPPEENSVWHAIPTRNWTTVVVQTKTEVRETAYALTFEDAYGAHGVQLPKEV